MNRNLIRDIITALAVILTLISCGETIYFIGSITEKSYEENGKYYYNRGKLEYYQPKKNVEFTPEYYE